MLVTLVLLRTFIVAVTGTAPAPLSESCSRNNMGLYLLAWSSEQVYLLW